MRPSLGWVGIVRLGLVQAALGSVTVLTISTLNRVMVVEWSLPALLPGALVALHYAIQALRPRLGHGSDMGGRRTPWIIGGMVALATGGLIAALGTSMMGASLLPGLLVSVIGFSLVGLGVGSAGTSLLVLMAARVAARRRAPAATILWLMMIAGIAVTACCAGMLLDPFSPRRLVGFTAVVACAALVVSVLAVWRLEGNAPTIPVVRQDGAGFVVAMRQVWAEPQARRFAAFVFVSMLAYSAQEMVLEPFAGAVFRMTPGGTAGLTGLFHAGVLGGMAGVALCCAIAGEFRTRAMRVCTVGGCAASALGLTGLAGAALAGPAWPLHTTVFLLGIANGAFAVSAIGAMMGLASAGRASREGVRVGLWGAAQAFAFAAGGLAGTGLIDATSLMIAGPAVAYATVFGVQALVFALAARMALGVFQPRDDRVGGPALAVSQAG
ncbi:BCD family MFS transporter [Acidisphaera sp. L21]|uniref:BCD family MFS transporter n=1 Tax=Acidisphaera sp. L21 TaxID=1641851 RepID=UPI00131C672C|nr:BCD family MFS transporter [Acidisphaera sp. L21]